MPKRLDQERRMQARLDELVGRRAGGARVDVAWIQARYGVSKPTAYRLMRLFLARCRAETPRARFFRQSVTEEVVRSVSASRQPRPSRPRRRSKRPRKREPAGSPLMRRGKPTVDGLRRRLMVVAVIPRSTPSAVAVRQLRLVLRCSLSTAWRYWVHRYDEAVAQNFTALELAIGRARLAYVYLTSGARRACRRGPANDPSAVVYFVQAGENGPIKIGSTTNLKQRLAALQQHRSEPLRVLGFVPGDTRVEKSFHAALAADRAFGEWFHPTVDVEAFVAATLGCRG